jgi:hypothetical protein
MIGDNVRIARNGSKTTLETTFPHNVTSHSANRPEEASGTTLGTSGSAGSPRGAPVRIRLRPGVVLSNP